MELISKRKFRVAVCYFIAYLCLVAFSLGASNRAPIRNNESLILTDYVNGMEIENVPYGNHSLSMALKDNYVLHAPASLMSGEGFHIKLNADLQGVPEAEVIVGLSANGYDLSACSFSTSIKEGENEIEGELVYEGVNHPQTAEISVYSTTPGAEITVTKPKFTRMERVRVGHLAYTALAATIFFAGLGTIMLIIDRKTAAREIREGINPAEARRRRME
ncbi:MAG: hypothetical protein E7302_00735 [Butyrivibrio sp.]|nr:hypothetical protein [Butyrivibrio sp.]